MPRPSERACISARSISAAHGVLLLFAFVRSAAASPSRTSRALTHVPSSSSTNARELSGRKSSRT